MSYAVLSDVHANLEALVAVMEDLHARDIGKVLFLGDAVGYGPDPDDCVRILKKECDLAIAGNHDRAVLNRTSIDYFNEHARSAVLWTQDTISDKSIEYLNSLGLTAARKKENIFLVHGTPKDPDAWNYIFSLKDLDVNFRHFKEKICFVGHSHVPFIAEYSSSGEIELHRESITTGPSEKYIINVGSVGQPRDNDPRASCALIDDGHIEIIRIEYDISKTQEKMRGAGLPEFLAERLGKGI